MNAELDALATAFVHGELHRRQRKTVLKRHVLGADRGPSYFVGLHKKTRKPVFSHHVKHATRYAVEKPADRAAMVEAALHAAARGHILFCVMVEQ